ncbi:nck-associated protein 5 isoform X4 [Balaenoptera ricei]|uniref:nck-associated protein 5 isoform X4 n=1 Tax=Balaenoptera ricei TaxID=2746895 RepID=UPI0028BDA056|nr:nck-associated protein 5 isoform X4 [Balaenoptera ricei]
MEGKRQLEKRDFGKRLSLDSSLVEYTDSNKYIEHLLTQLEEQHRSLWREKLAVARLQREVAQRRSEGAMHEKLIHELEEERHLRLQSEKRLQEVTLESERNRIQMRGLQQQFSRMEETVRNLLQSQGPPEQKKEETVNIMVYQEKLSEEERKHKEALEDRHMVVDEDSRSEGSSADEGKEKTKLLLERLKALEAENSALALENENQREQYERCLDEVANQVVQALLTQKDLREECVKLKTRVFDLEQQNRTLSILFQQRVRPTSDLLLQKLHSRILDLSTGDLLSDVERSRSLTHSRTDVEMHVSFPVAFRTLVQECQLNTKSGAPALKRPGMGVAIRGHLCPRSSCSSSELSLSSTCSEYSSGSSYTWHDGKNLRKRQSSQNWDKRLSIDSSLPSGFASPTDELPPTRIKESHILEGLRKLQKRKVLLEPPSVITKWGYKDCMNSNEGIYSPGIKSSSLKEYAPCKPTGTGSPCKEPHKAFVYDTDSHDDAEEDPSSLASLQAVPHQGCRLHGCKLTHSVSDSLFGWELNGKHRSEITSSVSPWERPEKLTSCASDCPLERKLYPSARGPQVQRERDPHSQGCLPLSLQLSDTDDTETLDELHIESSDEKSPSDVSLTVDADESMENLDVRVGFGRSQRGSPEEEEEQAPVHFESRPKTFSFIKQQRVVKRTSSEECITVIFDAEDGEPIEFSSHQTGLVTVTRKEISIHQAPAGSQTEHTELLPQGIAHLQPGAAARDYPFLKRSEEETERNIPRGEADDVAVTPTESFHPRTVTQNPQRQRLTKPTRATSCQSHSRSSVATGIYQKKSLTKIPTRGKSSPQKSRIMEPEASLTVPSTGPVTPERSPAPGKLSRFKKPEGPEPLFALPPDSHIPKPSTQLPHGSKMFSRRDWVQYSRSQMPASQLLPRPPAEPSDDGEPPTRDKHCDPGPEAGLRSPSLPSPPGRVDKKAAQQTESGSNNVSCRSVLKGSSQGSCVTGSSLGTQGTHKKNIKTKADMEIPKGSLIKEANEHLQEDEEDTVADSAFQSHTIETNCQMRTLDSGIGTFPLPDSGNRSTGRYIRQADSPEDTEPLLSLQPALCAASSIRAQTLEREVPSSADSRGPADNATVHSTSDPIMTARGLRPLQSRLPKPASSGKINSQMQSEAKARPQTCSSFKCAENTTAAASRPLLAWGDDSAAAETQKLKQVEETREDPENRLCKISLESFNKYNGNTVILLEKETNSLNKVKGQKEEKEKNEEASLSSSDRPGVDNLESLSDSLYDSFSSCASQGSNDV